jgi:hypothetical protein
VEIPLPPLVWTHKKIKNKKKKRRRKSDLATPIWPDLEKNYGAAWED